MKTHPLIPALPLASDVAQGAASLPVDRWRADHWRHEIDTLAEEVPVALQFNGISHAVMLATPANLEEFALGFALSEGILDQPADLYDIEISQSELSHTIGMTVAMTVASSAFARLKERRRNLTGRTGCGLCGTESLEQAIRSLPAVSAVTQSAGGQPATRHIALPIIQQALQQLNSAQPLQQQTGATHAAVWFNAAGNLLCAREDVGRHNALDKLIGALAMMQANLADGFVVITSRASVEMIQKAASMGMHTLVAVSAPTVLAVRTAQQLGMTLIGFARGQQLVAYAHAGELLDPPQAHTTMPAAISSQVLNE